MIFVCINAVCPKYKFAQIFFIRNHDHAQLYLFGMKYHAVEKIYKIHNKTFLAIQWERLCSSTVTRELNGFGQECLWIIIMVQITSEVSNLLWSENIFTKCSKNWEMLNGLIQNLRITDHSWNFWRENKSYELKVPHLAKSRKET